MKKSMLLLLMILLFTFYPRLISTISAAPSTESIKSMQEILNRWGYDCGTPDGIAGNKTKTALKKFEEDQKYENATGELDDNIIEYIFSGVPLKTFVERYNYAVDYWNSLKEITKASTISHIYYEEFTEEYNVNNNLSMLINPDYPEKKMVGLINLANMTNSFDPAITIVEIYCMIYAFDYYLSDPGNAVDIFDGIFDSSNGKYTNNNINYVNYSSSGIIYVIAENANFKNSSWIKSKQNEENIVISPDIKTSEEFYVLLNATKKQKKQVAKAIPFINDAKLENATIAKYSYKGTIGGLKGTYIFIIRAEDSEYGKKDEVATIKFEFDTSYKTSEILNVLKNLFEKEYYEKIVPYEGYAEYLYEAPDGLEWSFIEDRLDKSVTLMITNPTPIQ